MAKSRAIMLHPEHGKGHTTTHGLLAQQAGRDLVPHAKPDRDTANGYLRLTARILTQSRERPFSTIGILSAREGEGRTTAAVNLAICLGRTRGLPGRVLLVDGDLRSRSLSKLFQCDEDPEGPSEGPRFVNTQFNGVDLLVAPYEGDEMTLCDPTSLIDSFSELGSRYAHIVIDCPPVLDAPEGMIMRDCVEELVLVIKADETPLSTVQEVLTLLKRRVLGVILNGGECQGRASA